MTSLLLEQSPNTAPQDLSIRAKRRSFGSRGAQLWRRIIEAYVNNWEKTFAAVGSEYFIDP